MAKGASEDEAGVARAGLDIAASPGFASWLAETRCSLAVSIYTPGTVMFVGVDPQAGGRLWLFNRHIERARGIACTRDRLAVAGRYQIITFVDGHWGRASAGDDPVYIPQLATFTGDVDAHDIAFDGAGDIVFANTLFSCVARVSATHSFTPLWTPPFISRLVPEDRCHLNGIAMRDGAVSHATVIARSDQANGWRGGRRGGGALYDTLTSEPVVEGLSMPHSPRWHDGRLWLLNAGTGEFGHVDLARGVFEPIAFCPGYVRGLAFVGRYAVVAASEPRHNDIFQGLALQERLERDGVTPRCGLFVVDTAAGEVVHWLHMRGMVKELFDVAVIVEASKPTMVGFKGEDIRRVISIDPG